jgi:hypothetical protein
MSGAATSILWPFLAQIGWTFVLYGWLTVARTRAVKRGEIDYGCFVLGREEPLAIARITRNLGNQFELPTVFFAVVVLLVALDRASAIDVIAAWAFVFGRIAHSLVQTLTDNVPLRGEVFVINVIALAVLLGHVGVLAASGVGAVVAR